MVTGEDIDPEKVLFAANDALRATGKPELAMVEVAGADGDFPLGVTGKSLKRYLRDKYQDLVVYLATAEAKTSPRALRSPNRIGNTTMTNPDTLLVFDETVTRAGVEGWLRHLESAGAPTEMYRLGGTLVLSVADVDLIHKAGPELPAPTRQVSRNSDVWLGRKELRPGGTEVSFGPTTIGDGSVAVIAGPCAVESPEQTMATAAVVTEHGAVGLRGGVFKPRTSPHSFQGLQWDGLDLLAEARERTGLPVVTEVIDPEHVKRLAAVVDGLQIGARNMQNFALLTAVGQSGLPVVLKRGFGCTVEETLAAAEYLLLEGNDQVVLCERGIRTFEPSARFTLDLTAVALWKQRTHLPVMVDPSHSGGRPELVEPLSLAAVAAGADALIIDVHVAAGAGVVRRQPGASPTTVRRLDGPARSAGGRTRPPHERRIDRGLRCSLRSCSWRSSGLAHAVCRSRNASAQMLSRFCRPGANSSSTSSTRMCSRAARYGEARRTGCC